MCCGWGVLKSVFFLGVNAKSAEYVIKGWYSTAHRLAGWAVGRAMGNIKKKMAKKVNG